MKICEDILFCELNFEIKFLTLVSSTLSKGIIIDTIRPLSMTIIVNLYMSWWVM